MVKNGLIEVFRRAFRSDRFLHPVERGMAKQYILQRLVDVFPELRGDPVALDRAYKSLSLEPRAGHGPNEAPTVFEMSAPE